MENSTAKLENLKIFDARNIAKRLNEEYDDTLLPEHILRPQGERISTFFRLFLKKEFEVSEESLFCLPFQAQVEAEENESEMFRNSYSTIILYKTLSSLYNDIFAMEFTITDLISPEPERIRHLLSLIVHFVEVVRRLDEPAKRVHEELASDVQEFKRLEIQARALEEKLVEERRNDEARKRRENQLSEDKHRLISQVKELARDSEMCRADITDLIADIEKHKAKMAEIETRSKELAHKEKYLLEAIIDNPAQMLAEKQELVVLRDDLKESLHKSRTELAELKVERELHGKIASLMETGKGEKEDLKQTRKLFDQANLELVALEREMDHFRLDVEAAKQDQAANEANRVDAENAHEKALVQHEELMNELKTSINKLTAELEKHKASGGSLNKENAKAEIREKQHQLIRLRNELERRQHEVKMEWTNTFNRISMMRRAIDEGTQRFTTLLDIHKNASLGVQQAMTEEGVQGHNGSFVQLASPARSTLEHSTNRTPSRSAKKSVARLHLSNISQNLTGNNTLNISHSSKRMSGSARISRRLKDSETYDGEHSFTGPLGRF